MRKFESRTTEQMEMPCHCCWSKPNKVFYGAPYDILRNRSIPCRRTGAGSASGPCSRGAPKAQHLAQDERGTVADVE